MNNFAAVVVHWTPVRWQALSPVARIVDEAEIQLMAATAAGILVDTNESNDETPFELYRAGHAAEGCLNEVGSCERAANQNDLFLECVDPD